MSYTPAQSPGVTQPQNVSSVQAEKLCPVTTPAHQIIPTGRGLGKVKWDDAYQALSTVPGT